MAFLIIQKKGGGWGVCTGYMIAENKIMTNSHCIPPLKKKESCEGKLFFLVKSSNGQVKRGCKQIINNSKYSPNSEMKPDYAMVEVDKPVSAQTFEISRDGIDEKLEYTVNSFDIKAYLNQYYAHFRTSTCRPDAFTRAGNYADIRSTIVPLRDGDTKDCIVIPGNSGSPLVSPNGQVVGTVFRSVVEPRFIAKIGRLVIATNFSCLKLGDPELDASISPECEKFLKSEKKFHARWLARQKKIYEEKMAEVEEATKKILPTNIQYSKLTQSKSKFSFLPECIRPLDQWPDDERSKILQDMKYEVLIPVYDMKIRKKDDRKRPGIVIDYKKTSELKLTIDDISKVIDGETAKVKWTGSFPKLPKTLTVCE